MDYPRKFAGFELEVLPRNASEPDAVTAFSVAFVGLKGLGFRAFSVEFIGSKGRHRG